MKPDQPDQRLQLLVDIEHSLKSPLLAAVRTAQQALNRDSPTREDMILIRALCNRAYAQLSTFRTFATLTSGKNLKFQLAPISVSEITKLLKTAAQDTEALERNRNPHRFVVEVVGREDATVDMDINLFGIAISNVFDNASKYSFPNSQVRVTVRTVKKGAEICVSSKGLPILPEDREHLFKHGWRSKAAVSATSEGSGIGLWIVSQSMKALNGDISVEMAENVTAFTLKLPYSPRRLA